MTCDAEGCTADAVVALMFRGMPGHVHVCARHEAIDREWGDVVASAPMPCPEGCADNPLPTYREVPTLLT